VKLRPYQQKAKDDIYASWKQGRENVMAVLPTGAGKTVIFSDVLREHRGASCAIAHRQELVTQISVALARDGVKHRIIGDNKVVKLAVRLHMDEVGRSYYDPSAQCAVAGIDTLLRRTDGLGNWLNSVTLWATDECHHLLLENKWGKGVQLFPNAKGLGVTATPVRADGKGLGRHTDGVIDVMIEGPSMRDLINMGYLTEYRVFAPPSDIDLEAVKVSAATGDYNRDGLVKAVRKSHIVGDVVSHYLKIASGKRGVTFATDVETATKIAKQFNTAGVPAAVVSAKTADSERVRMLRDFKNGKIVQLVNVDLFGEGFDLPAIEVVSMARPTQSYALYAQQFGRALRIMDGKTEAIIIDHVGNVIRHGLPDAPRKWSLDRRDKRGRGKQDEDVIPVTSCPDCTAVYERVYRVCPYCGYEPVPAGRSSPEFVDGDLTELDAATLSAMRGEVAKVDRSEEEYRLELASKRVPPIGQLANVKRHRERQAAQATLRDAIALWAGHRRAEGRPDSESYRRFYFKFGTDVLSAQALGTAEAAELEARVRADIEKGVA
jgi:DNA repair protein RadD